MAAEEVRKGMRNVALMKREISAHWSFRTALNRHPNSDRFRNEFGMTELHDCRPDMFQIGAHTRPNNADRTPAICPNTLVLDI